MLLVGLLGIWRRRRENPPPPALQGLGEDTVDGGPEGREVGLAWSILVYDCCGFLLSL